jgi:hypothetical protein
MMAIVADRQLVAAAVRADCDRDHKMFDFVPFATIDLSLASFSALGTKCERHHVYIYTESFEG